MRKRSELLFNLLLVPLDGLTLLSSYIAAYLIRVDFTPLPTAYQISGSEYLAALIAWAPLNLFIFAATGLYLLDTSRSRLMEYGRVIVATSASAMALIIVDFFTTKPLFPSKSVVIYGLAISTVLIITMRFILSVIQRWLYRFNIGRRHVVVIGKGVAADALTFAFQKNRGYKLERTITDDVDALDSLKRLLRRHHIDEIYMANTRVSEKEQLKLIRFAHENHIVYKYVPTLTDLYQAKMQTLALADMPVLEVVRTPLEGWSRIIKTMADYIIGLIVLVALSPLFLILSIVIKLTDGGNVFYRHSRVGRYGKKIEVWKFRSMYMQYSTGSGFSGKTDAEILSELGDSKMVAEFKKEQKLKNDPRVTPIGRFLRKTSLDELPQLFNVLRGELSLIGPRPVTSDELERYNESASTFLLIKPGITGLWQVSGRNDIGYDERIRLDVYYVEHWSVWLDCKIFARTLKVVLFGKGY